jgi:phosphate transport system substrate-binding protein
MYASGTVDFGATDAPLTDQQMERIARKPLHIPVIAGAVVLAYNVPGVGPGLKLTGDIIADLFLGRITRWDDARIAKANPTLKLPALPVTVCHRFDGSGTTYVFTDYLSSVSEAWRAKIGKGRAVNWPTGVAGNGNGGVADALQAKPGAVGYVELAYAVKRTLSFGPVANRKGRFVTASAASTSAALDGAASRMRQDVRVSLVTTEAQDAYPICGVTYVLVARAPNEEAKSRAIADFLTWVVGPGQAIARELSYAALPKTVAALDRETLSQMTTGGSKVQSKTAAVGKGSR